MNEQLEILKEAINSNREGLILELFSSIEFEGMDEQEFFKECLLVLQEYEKKQYKLLHAFELQKVHDDVFYGGL